MALTPEELAELAELEKQEAAVLARRAEERARREAAAKPAPSPKPKPRVFEVRSDLRPYGGDRIAPPQRVIPSLDGDNRMWSGPYFDE